MKQNKHPASQQAITSTQYVKAFFKHSKELHKYIIIYLFHRSPVKAPILLSVALADPEQQNLYYNLPTLENLHTIFDS